MDRLPSGQRLITERMENVRSVCLGFWIPVGSRDEPRELAGITHFIEHLFFKGSERYSTEEIAQAFDVLGGEVNAATSKEYVLLFGRVLDEELPRAMDLLMEMLLVPSFSDLDREREVVLEEIAMYEDSPQELIHDVLMDAVFSEHPLGHPVLGFRDSVGEASEDVVRTYHADNFRFEDMVVAAAGNVDSEAVKDILLERYPGGHGPGISREPIWPATNRQTGFLVKETEQMHVCLGGKGMAHGDERRYALSVLDSLLGGSLSSRLFQEVREKRGLVYSVFSFTHMFGETGLCGVYFGCRPERLDEVMDTMVGELKRLGREKVPEEELERAKQHLKGRVILSLESTQSRMSRLGRSLLADTEILSLDEVAERIDAVSTEDVVKLAREHYDPEKMSIVGIGGDESHFGSVVSNHGSWVAKERRKDDPDE